MTDKTRHDDDFQGQYSNTAGKTQPAQPHSNTPGVDPNHSSHLHDGAKTTQDLTDKIKDTSDKAEKKSRDFSATQDQGKGKFDAINADKLSKALDGAGGKGQSTGASMSPQQAPQQASQAPQQAPQAPQSSPQAPQAPQMSMPQTPQISQDALKQLLSNIDPSKLGTDTGATESGAGDGKKGTPKAISTSDVRFQKIAGNPVYGLEARRAIIDKALTLNGVPEESKEQWMNTMLFLQEKESGGQANAVNNYDSNAVGEIMEDGSPYQSSRSLNQVIPPTFAANHIEGTSENIYDPEANTASSVHYIMSRYKVPPEGGQALADFDAARHVNGYTGY